MNSTPLEFDSVDTPPPRRRGTRWTLGAVAAIVLIAFVAPLVTVRRIESRIDTVTGSMTWTTVWFYCISSGPRVEVSPLETRLKNDGIAWTPSSRLLHHSYLNMFGRPTMYGCATSPPILSIRLALNEFVAASTEAELREFVRVMQFGDEAEQYAAVEAAMEKVLTVHGTGG